MVLRSTHADADEIDRVGYKSTIEKCTMTFVVSRKLLCVDVISAGKSETMIILPIRSIASIIRYFRALQNVKMLSIDVFSVLFGNISVPEEAIPDHSTKSISN